MFWMTMAYARAVAGLANVADMSYSVNSALKFSANTASTLGRMIGSFTL